MDQFTCKDWKKFNTILWCYEPSTQLVKSKSIKSRKDIGLHLTKKKHPAIINLSLNKKSCISKLNEQDYLNHETFVKKKFHST